MLAVRIACRASRLPAQKARLDASCRQALYEFNPDLLVIVENPEKSRLNASLRHLLPHGFGPGDFEPRPGLISDRIERSG